MTAKIIVIACDTFAPDHNGTATFAKNLASALQLKGREVHVIAPATSKLYGTFREKHDDVAFVVHRLKSYRLPFQPSQRFVNPFRLSKRISGLLGAIKPDVVHIQNHLNVGHHAALAARAQGIRLVATSHLDLESLVNNTILAPKFVRTWLTKMLLDDAARVFRGASAITVASTRAKALLEKAVSGLAVYAISGGVDIKRFAKIPPADQSSKELLYVGRLDREKHVYVALAAIAKLPQDSGITLTLVGGGSQASELEQLALELGVNDRVHFAGELDDPGLFRVLKGASAFLMPSAQELQSMATLEAMAAGKPVIAANAMALPSLVQDGKNGFLFEPDSPNDLAQKIEELFALDSKDFNGFGVTSRKIAETHNLSSTIATFERLYNGLSLPEPDNAADLDFAPSSGLNERFEDFIEARTSGVLERLDGVRGAVAESFTDARFSIERRSKRVRRRISKSLRKALDALRRDE